MSFARVCVYAGSTPGADPAYAAAARALGALLARRGIGVVYGGGRVGLMGAVADAALAAGGEVIGVLPQSLDDREIGHTGLTELRVVASMHERKALMAELAGAFVALPGGLGTIEELVEAATWTQLGIHRKPVGLLDVNGYWRPLDTLLDHAVRERFVRIGNRELIVTGEDPAVLLDALERWRPPDGSTTLDRERAQVLVERDAPVVARDPADAATGAAPAAPVALGAPRIGVGAFVVRDGRLLLGLRRGAHGSGTWSAPGGALEAGEAPAAAALRELEEETGLRGRGATPIGVTNDVFAAEGQHWVTLHMLVDCPDGEPWIREPRKCERLEWFDLDALPGPLFAPLQALVDGGWRGPGR